jgi:hypothetical protein
MVLRAVASALTTTCPPCVLLGISCLRRVGVQEAKCHPSIRHSLGTYKWKRGDFINIPTQTPSSWAILLLHGSRLERISSLLVSMPHQLRSLWSPFFLVGEALALLSSPKPIFDQGNLLDTARCHLVRTSFWIYNVLLYAPTKAVLLPLSLPPCFPFFTRFCLSGSFWPFRPVVHLAHLLTA